MGLTLYTLFHSGVGHNKIIQNSPYGLLLHRNSGKLTTRTSWGLSQIGFSNSIGRPIKKKYSKSHLISHLLLKKKM